MGVLSVCLEEEEDKKQGVLRHPTVNLLKSVQLICSWFSSPSLRHLSLSITFPL